MKLQFSLASSRSLRSGVRTASRLLLGVGAALFLTSFSQAFADELGASVTITGNYSTGTETIGTGMVTSGGYTVGDPGAFDSISLEALPDAVDLTNITTNAFVEYLGPFTYEFAFSGGSAITGVSFASNTISGLTLSDVTFDDDDVWINLTGLTVDAGQGLSLDLDFGPVSTTPEPGGLVLLGTGLIFLFGAMRWKLRGNRPSLFPAGYGGL